MGTSIEDMISQLKTHEDNVQKLVEYFLDLKKLTPKNIGLFSEGFSALYKADNSEINEYTRISMSYICNLVLNGSISKEIIEMYNEQQLDKNMTKQQFDEVKGLVSKNEIKEAIQKLIVYTDGTKFVHAVRTNIGAYNDYEEESMAGIGNKTELKTIIFNLSKILEKIRVDMDMEEIPILIPEDNQGFDKTLLYFASNPTDTKTIKLEKEFVGVFTAIDKNEAKVSINTNLCWHTTIDTFILETRKRRERGNIDYLHFAGHGNSSGLIFQNEQGKAVTIDDAKLKDIFELFKDTYKINFALVFLNACYSSSQIKAILPYTQYLIATNDAVGDDAAVKFAQLFYGTIAEGQTIESAFKTAKVSVSVHGLPYNAVFELYKDGKEVIGASTILVE